MYTVQYIVGHYPHTGHFLVMRKDDITTVHNISYLHFAKFL
jgi:hypothetical protein